MTNDEKSKIVGELAALQKRRGDLTGGELPRYRCHKVVRAAKILALRGGVTQTLVLEGVEAPVQVDVEYLAKHKPQVGGYYVVYEDGYESWSPAEVFEAGYTAIGEGE